MAKFKNKQRKQTKKENESLDKILSFCRLCMCNKKLVSFYIDN